MTTPSAIDKRKEVGYISPFTDAENERDGYSMEVYELVQDRG